jgi:hypothetical protein
MNAIALTLGVPAPVRHCALGRDDELKGGADLPDRLLHDFAVQPHFEKYSA